jgi:mRNA interferase YafQ
VRRIIFTSQFKKDVKLAEKRHKDMTKLLEVFRLLVGDETLPARYKDHRLTGNWQFHRDMHIEPDWILLYRIDDEDVVMARTGTHADIF